MAGFRKEHMRTFVYSSCHVYCSKMRAYALYGIQPLSVAIFSNFAISNFTRNSAFWKLITRLEMR